MRLELSAKPALGSGLLADYLSRAPKTMALFDYDPYDPAAYAARAADVARRYSADRAAISAALVAYNTALGADEAALDGARRLASPEALTVVTGQQPGILGGPAYSVFKAITAILLARRESERLSAPVVPVFWIAAEDHDFAEISFTELPVGERVQRLHLKEHPERKASVGHLPLSPEVAGLIDEFAALMPGTEFKDAVLQAVRETAVGDYGEWFGRLMAWLFRGTGLVFINPLLPEARRQAAPVFARAIAGAPEVGAGLDAGYAAVTGAGYAPAVERTPGSLGLFTYHQGERLRLLWEGDRVWLRDDPAVSWSRSELAELALAEPERFSPDVTLRPVSQGYILPDLACICGPGEVAYWALLGPVFAACGRTAPVVYPRLSATLVEPPLARNLEKQELTLAEVFGTLAERRQALLDETDPIGLDQVFSSFRADLDQRLSGLLAQLKPLGANLEQQGDEHRRQILLQLTKWEEKARQQHRKNCETFLKQLDRLAVNLAPHDKPQDRAFTILPYLIKYGPDLPQRLADLLQLTEPWQHQVVYLGD